METERERAEWLERRKGTIGGSWIAAVAGIDPFRGKMEAYLVHTGQKDEQPTEAMEDGLLMEPVIAKKYERKTGARLFEIPLRDQPRRHPTAPHVSVSLDRRTEEFERIVEIKNTGWRQAWRWGEPGTDQAPQHVLAQVQLQLEVYDCEKADVAVFIGGEDFRIYPVQRDREAGGLLVEAAERFWRDHVETGEPPMLDASDASAEYLRRKWPHATEEVKRVEPFSPLDELVQTLRTVRYEQATAEDTRAFLENRIKAEMGDAAVLEFAGGRITWKDVTTKRVDLAALRAALDITPYEKTTSARRFVARFEKEDGDS